MEYNAKANIKGIEYTGKVVTEEHDFVKPDGVTIKVVGFVAETGEKFNFVPITDTTKID